MNDVEYMRKMMYWLSRGQSLGQDFYKSPSAFGGSTFDPSGGW